MRAAIVKTCVLLFLVSNISFQSAYARGRVELQMKSLIPKEKELKTILIAKDPEFYDPGRLSFYLRGQEKDLLEEYGIQGLLVLSFYTGGEIITTEIYNLEDSRAAFGLFTIKRVPSTKPFKVGDESIQSDSSITFWQDKFFVKSITIGTRQDTKSAIEKISKIISSKIQKHSTKPWYVEYLPEKGMVKQSLKIIKGPLGFKKYSEYYPDNILTARKDVREGLTVRYEGDWEFSFCLLRYDSLTESINALDKILNNLRNSSVYYRYLFDVLMYRGEFSNFKINRIDNYISILKYNGEYKYDWFIKGISKRIYG